MDAPLLRGNGAASRGSVRGGGLWGLPADGTRSDPGRFPDPDRFDIGRRQAGALGFGHGAHSCIGAGLARMQCAMAVRVLLERAPDLELDPAHEVEWSPLAGVEGPEAMRVRVRAARAARRAR